MALPFILAACGSNPLGKLAEPAQFTPDGQWSGLFAVYDDEIKTDGGVMFLGVGDGFAVDFNCNDSPYGGLRCMAMRWDGSAVTTSEGTSEAYTGFSLIVDKDYHNYLTSSRDLSPGGYTKVSFHARKGFLSSNAVLRVEGPVGSVSSVPPNNAWEGTLTDSWQEYSFAVTGDVSAVHHYVSLILKNTDGRKGNGGTVYIDNVRLSR